MLLVVRVVGHSAGHAHNEDIVNLLECAQQPSGRVARRRHRLTCAARRRQLGADDAMCANVAQGINIRFAFEEGREGTRAATDEYGK